MEDTTIVLTTHDLAEAEKLASRIVILAGGGIIADGSPLERMQAVSSTAEVRWKQEGQRHVHASQDATAFVRGLLAREGERITDLEIERRTLEDAYLSIVEQLEAGAVVEATEFEAWAR